MENITLINDFDTLVKIDCRGEIIKIYKHLLAKSVYFCFLIKSKETQQEDGSYYLDCDPDIFRELLAYMETGKLRKTEYAVSYIEAMCDKFGIEHNIKRKKKPTKEDELDTLEKIKEKKSKAFGDKLQSFIGEKVKLNDTCTVKFISGQISEFKTIDNELICICDIRGMGFVITLLSSHLLLKEFLIPITPENKTIFIEDVSRKYNNKFMTLSIV